MSVGVAFWGCMALPSGGGHDCGHFWVLCLPLVILVNTETLTDRGWRVWWVKVLFCVLLNSDSDQFTMG